jgi:hypothetical protein
MEKWHTMTPREKFIASIIYELTAYIMSEFSKKVMIKSDKETLARKFGLHSVCLFLQATAQENEETVKKNSNIDTTQTITARANELVNKLKTLIFNREEINHFYMTITDIALQGTNSEHINGMIKQVWEKFK